MVLGMRQFHRAGHLFVGWLFWLRQGQGNGGVQELERTVAWWWRW